MTVFSREAKLEISAGFVKQFPSKNVPHIALSGRSNVGKSSLLNAVLNRKNLARVSSAPGKTVTVNFYDVGGKFYFVDLPGYGFACGSKAAKARWSELTDGYFTKNKNIDLLRLVLQLVDSRVGITKDDEMMLEFMNNNNIPHAVVITKTDKLKKSELDGLCEKFAENPAAAGALRLIPFSAKDGRGLEPLRETILSALGSSGRKDTKTCLYNS